MISPRAVWTQSGGGDIVVVRGDLWCAEDAVFLAQWEFRSVVLFRVGILLLELCY